MNTAPLTIRNTGPIHNLYGLPRAQGAELIEQGVEVGFGVDHGNSFTGSNRAEGRVFLDGETGVANLSLRWGFADRWEAGIELPYVVHTNSGLDSFVDEFHEFFGFGDAGRDLIRRGRIDYLIRVDGVQEVAFTDSREGLGDPRLLLGWQVLQSPRRATALRGSLKLPVGEVGDLTGSEAYDLAVWLEHSERQVLGFDRVSLNLAIGATYLGEGELLQRRQRSGVATGHLGLQIQLLRSLQVHLQADAHSSVFDSTLGELEQDGLQGTIGGRWQPGRRWWVDFGVIENINGRSAPDVVFQLRVAGRL